MQLPENRFGFSSKRDRRKKRNRIVVLVSLIALLAVAGVLIFGLPAGEQDGSTAGKPPGEETETKRREGEEEQTLSALWKRKEYARINEVCEERLREEPLKQEYLAYNGFAYFYRGVSQYTLEDQLNLFDKSVRNLRKILIYDAPMLEEKVHYILGKAYYHKGRFYTDAAIRHLDLALEQGYEAVDIHRYLGLSYGRLDEYATSVEHFLKAAEVAADPILFMTIGRTYYKMERDEEAVEHLQRAINAAESSAVKEKSRFLLGKIFLDQGALNKAESQYERILSDNPRSADAHYYLGEVYERKQERVKARAEWRKTLEIDPSHHGALLKLYD
jgi:tetratricopeptide (TPR) repeat protein